jgi:hypothetical protein
MSDVAPSPVTLSKLIGDATPRLRRPLSAEEVKRRQAIEEFDEKVRAETAIYKALIEAAGFSVTPFERKPRWRFDEDPEKMAYFPPQYLAALQIFYKMFVQDDKKAWIHLSAEMQSGKTGVMNSLIRLIIANAELCQMACDSIFVLTGMSDRAWVKQTVERVVYDVRENIKHSGTLKKISPTLTLMSRRDGGLKNILIIVDESHIAASEANRPFKEVYNFVKGLCGSKFIENNIKFVTVSATDPAMNIATHKVTAGVGSVRLMNNPRYLSVQKLNELGRIMRSSDLAAEANMDAFYTFIAARPELHKKYIIIRARGVYEGTDRTTTIKKYINEMFSEFSPVITEWDSKAPRPDRIAAPTDGSSVSSKMEDINELLSVEPDTLHFIMVKGMFYAAKTMDTEHVGVLYDSSSIHQKHDTALQSFLGRACGYNKNTNLFIFGNMEAVETYIDIWRDIESKMKEMPGGNIIIEDGDGYCLNGKMNGFGTKAINGETAAKVDAGRAVPLVGFIKLEALQPVDGRMTVPIVLKFDEDFITSLIAAPDRRSFLLNKLKGLRYNKYNTLNKFKLLQITHPEADGSYKRHIEDMVRWAAADKPASIDVHLDEKNTDNWQAFIDSRENRVIITIWNGTKAAL